MDEVLEKYPNDVKVVIKNFPLPNHQQARRAAQYCLAAEKVKPGSYKEMYHAIFADYGKLGKNPDMPLEIAKTLGINPDELLVAANDPAIDAQIEKEIAQLKSLGIRLAVPKFLIAGKEPEGRRNIDTWSAIIDAELKKNKK